MSRLLFCIGSLCLLLLPAPTRGGTETPAVRLLVSNSAPYVGEETILTLEVRYRGRLRERPTVRWPELHRFVVEDLPPLPPRRLDDSAGPMLVESARRSLRPVTAGRLSLAGGIDLGGAFFSAAPLSLRIRPLPERERPPAFAGAVGRAELTLRAEGTGTREVAMVLKGNAPLHAFPEPRVVPGSGERIVPLGETFSGSAGQARERTFRYLYLPGEGRRGRLTATLDVFDPVAERYEQLHASLDDGGGLTRKWLPAAALIALGGWLLARRQRRRASSLEEILERLLGRSPAGLCRERVIEGLDRAGVPHAAIEDLKRLWEAEDRSRFGDRRATAVELAGLRRRAVVDMRNAVDKSRRIP